MSETIARTRVARVLLLAIALTTLAEALYLVVWGMMLFPKGPLLSKTVWAAACGIGMGAVIGALTLLLIEGRRHGYDAFRYAVVIVAVVGSLCALLCAQIDQAFNYFGGVEDFPLFVWSGVVPAALGGVLYGWLLYLPSGTRVAERLGL